MTSAEQMKALNSMKSVADSLKSKPISSTYLEAEKAIVDRIIKKSAREIKSITMSNSKFHKSFSL